MAPSHGTVHIRIPCPACGWAEKRSDRTRLVRLDEDGATFTAVFRVNDSSRRKIRPGSLIRFRCQGDEVLTRVARVNRYTSFEEMFDHEPVASVNPLATREDQLANIRQIHPPEREAIGVVAIGIELLHPARPI